MPVSRKFKFLTIEKTRHGKTVYYFRRGNGPRTRLPDDIKSRAFEAAYFSAAHGDAPPAPQEPLHEPKFNGKLKQKVGVTLDRALSSAKGRAKNKGMDFDLDIVWLTAQVEAQHFKCAMTGIPFFSPSNTPSSMNPYRPSIDRIDSKRGYTKDNVRVIVTALNFMLLDWGEATFERVANCYRRNKNTTVYARTKKELPRT